MTLNFDDARPAICFDDGRGTQIRQGGPPSPCVFDIFSQENTTTARSTPRTPGDRPHTTTEGTTHRTRPHDRPAIKGFYLTNFKKPYQNPLTKVSRGKQGGKERGRKKEEREKKTAGGGAKAPRPQAPAAPRRFFLSFFLFFFLFPSPLISLGRPVAMCSRPLMFRVCYLSGGVFVFRLFVLLF